MSAFYLDILKDRLYASAPKDPQRRAAQTVLYDALTAITKLIAPILPHTADEVWNYIPGIELPSVQIAELPQVDRSLFDGQLEEKWEKFTELRDDVLKSLEEARKAKLIGNSLSAAVHLYPDQETQQFLSGFDRLDLLFIVSAVHVHEAGAAIPEDAHAYKGMSVSISVAEGEKCERCWIVTPEVGHHETHPSLCKRCAEVLESGVEA